MLLRFTPVPAGALPVGVTATIVEGDLEAVYLIDSSATLAEVCEALTDLTNEYASQAWVHVGLPLDFDIQKISD